MTSTAQNTETNIPSAPLRWTITPKGKNPAHIGAAVIHPDGSIGTVVGGQAAVTFGGKPAACVGDKVECPGHTGVILEGAKGVSIGGKALAREGDKTSCGGVIMNGFPTITVYDLGKTVHGKQPDEVGREMKISLFQSAHSEESSYVGMPYELYVDGQKITDSVTDEQGDVFVEVKSDTQSIEIKLANGIHYQIDLIEDHSQELEKDKISRLGFHQYDDTDNMTKAQIAQQYFEIAQGMKNGRD